MPASYAPFVLLIVLVPTAIAYGIYFRRRKVVKAAGGREAYDQQQLDKHFFGGSYGPERVTAGWAATTLPDATVANAAIDVAGAALALATGTGVKVVGRPIVIACTTADRLLYSDTGSGEIIPLHRGYVRITDTGRKGTKRTDKHTWGFVPGRVLRFDFPDGVRMDIDIISTAVPTLLGWAAGAISVARLNGPYAFHSTY